MTDDARLRFSLKTLLAIMTAGSLMLAAVVAFPDVWASGAIMALLQIVPLTLLFGSLWGERYQRAFCIGALVPAAVTLFAMGSAWIIAVIDTNWSNRTMHEVMDDVGRLMTESHVTHRLVASFSWTFSLLLGLIALALRRWVFRGDA